MADVLLVALVVGFFLLALLFVRGCEALTRGAPELGEVADEEVAAR